MALPAVVGIGALLDAIHAMVMVLDTEGRILRFNRRCEEVTGYSTREVQGRRVEDLALVPASAPTEERSAFTRLVSRLPACHDGVWRTRDGRLRDIEWTLAALDGPGGEGHLVVCTGVDVTARSHIQREFQEQLHFLQTLIDSIPNPIFYKSVDGLYRGCNHAFEQMLGLTRHQLVGKSVRDIAPMELAERYEQKDLELFRNPGIQQYEWAVRFASGEVRDVIFYKATYVDSGGTLIGLVGVMLDITERKHAERALQETRDALEERVRLRTAQLEAADQTKSEFLNIAAHELRTPLTALRLVLQKSRRELASGVLLSEPTLSRLERYADRLTRMSGDLLDASRLERGTLLIHRQSFDLGALVRDVIADFRLQWPERRLEVELSPRQAPVSADRDRLEQVLSNLLDNASKYTPRDTPVGVQLKVDASRVRVSIRDEGPGIPQEDQARLFQRFQRLDSSVHQPGLGLGLYISREIVESHGGTLELRSEPGRPGALFSFELPLEG